MNRLDASVAARVVNPEIDRVRWFVIVRRIRRDLAEAEVDEILILSQVGLPHGQVGDEVGVQVTTRQRLDQGPVDGPSIPSVVPHRRRNSGKSGGVAVVCVNDPQVRWYLRAGQRIGKVRIVWTVGKRRSCRSK
ncbi:MAG: hypothetical protein O3C68_03525 [Proteobacteria bacterium]|nr:hypothetical protein [Pseudomonadota bacterium]